MYIKENKKVSSNSHHSFSRYDSAKKFNNFAIRLIIPSANQLPENFNFLLFNLYFLFLTDHFNSIVYSLSLIYAILYKVKTSSFLTSDFDSAFFIYISISNYYLRHKFYNFSYIKVWGFYYYLSLILNFIIIFIFEI